MMHKLLSKLCCAGQFSSCRWSLVLFVCFVFFLLFLFLCFVFCCFYYFGIVMVLQDRVLVLFQYGLLLANLFTKWTNSNALISRTCTMQYSVLIDLAKAKRRWGKKTGAYGNMDVDKEDAINRFGCAITLGNVENHRWLLLALETFMTDTLPNRWNFVHSQ